MLNNIKPFYIYEDNHNLYIKNINDKIEKVSSNVVSYCANFDDDNSINICCIDTKGKLLHLFYKNGKFKKRVLCKACNNISYLKNMRLYIVNNFINVFVLEESSIKDDTYRLSHYNYNSNKNSILKFYFNNILRKDDSIYKLTIDDMQNMIFTYETPSTNRGEVPAKSLVFNNRRRKWIPSNGLMRSSYGELENIQSSTTIKDDIFEYCYGITYNKH